MKMLNGLGTLFYDNLMAHIVSFVFPYLINLINNFRFMSQIISNVARLFRVKYQIESVYRNPLCAVTARVQIAQRSDPRLSDLRNIYILNV